jgi:hypothetical protein
MSPHSRKKRSTGNYGHKDDSLHGFSFKHSSPESAARSSRPALRTFLLLHLSTLPSHQ